MHIANTPAKEAETVTQAERNAAIAKKIAAYTAKFTIDQKSAREALLREGLTKKPKRKEHSAAA